MDEYQKFVSEVILSGKTLAPALWFIFLNDQLLLFQHSFYPPIPCLLSIDELGVTVVRQHYFGLLGDTACFCAELSREANIPSNMRLQSLRQSYDCLGDTLFNVAGRGLQVLNWDKNHQFCGRCAIEMQYKLDERVKVCPRCQLHNYPRLSPCIIVLINRGSEILLARSPHFTPGIYSALAGFIEIGETAEQAVEREVMEEVSIRVTNIRYVCSQAWPFPDSLMLGFFADYAGGEIKIDEKEIEAANWYSIHHLPTLPHKASIAYRLVTLYQSKLGN